MSDIDGLFESWVRTTFPPKNFKSGISASKFEIHIYIYIYIYIVVGGKMAF